MYIECPYTQAEYHNTKYWCLRRDGQWQSLVSTYSGRKGQSSDERITVENDATRKTVSITMTDLKTEDSGTYFCSAYYCYNSIPPRMISLNVFNGEYLYPTPNQVLSRKQHHPFPCFASLTPTAEQLPLIPPSLTPCFPSHTENEGAPQTWLVLLAPSSLLP